MNLTRTRAMASKEIRHILRDPRSLIMALAVPLLMLVLFGYALSLDVDRIPVSLLDQDHTPESRALVREFQGSRFFQIVETASGYAQIEKSIDRSRVLMAIVIPPSYAHHLNEGSKAPVQIILDGSDSNTATIAMGYAQSTLSSTTRDLALETQNRRGNGGTASRVFQLPIDARTRVLYNNELKSRNFVVPGLVAIILQVIASLLTSLTIAREWEMGTMEQLLSTPVRPSEIVLGKMLAFFAVGLIDMAVVVSFGLFVFRVPFRGSFLLLIATGLVFLFGSLSWGIFLSAVARNQLQAYQMGMLTSYLPAMLLSGFVFAIQNMPAAVQLFTRLVPSRYFITIITGIFLKGVGLEVLWLDGLLLLVFAVVVFWAATRKLSQKLV